MLGRQDFNLQAIVRPNIWSLKPYRCARDDYVDGILMDANENAYGPALEQNNMIIGNAPADSISIRSDSALERYPDPRQDDIKSRLCALRKIPSVDYFFVGVGSDECIDICMRVFCVPGRDKILITPPTYGMYSVSAQVNDLGIVRVPLNLDDFSLNVQGILDALDRDENIKVCFLCSPGNPTGTLLKRNDIISILMHQKFQGIVFVDEAYIDFCSFPQDSASELVKDFPNLIVSQTLSKAFGCAGVRCGWTISSPEIAMVLNKTKAPYSISTPTSLIAKTALSESGVKVMQEKISKLIEQRQILIEKFKAFPFFGKVLGGNHANFILVTVVDLEKKPSNDLAMAIYKQLAEKEGIVVRYRGTELGCTGALRITVGTHTENEFLIKTLQSDVFTKLAK